MTSVVFLRAVNVGGRVMKMGDLVGSLSPLDVRTVGAAGTLVVQGSGSSQMIRRTVVRALPFPTTVMVVPAVRLVKLLDADPFGSKPLPEGAKRYVSILEQRPSKLPSLPLRRPNSKDWEVWVTQILGDFVLSLSRRRSERRLLYPNELVERELGVGATTRGWETIERVGSLLRGDRSSG
jgi:uncharacterized protein (DUF1697 family)